MKKVVIFGQYILGFFLVGLGISLHFHHGFGNASIDALNLSISKIIKVPVGYVIMAVNFLFVFLYFIKKRNKDIYLSIIGILLLGNLVNLLNYLFSYIDNTNMAIKIFDFILAVNVQAIGIAIILRTKLSMMALECFVILVNELKIFSKLSIGTARMIVDVLLICIAVCLDVFVSKSFVFTGYAVTFILVFINGPVLNLYIKLFAKLDKKKQVKMGESF